MSTIEKNNPLIETPKTISAFVRCFNEEEFIEASVRSIIDSVDEVIISDGGSTDNSVNIINILKREYVDKIQLYPYHYSIVKTGEQHFGRLCIDKNGPNMPHIYNNWLLEKCKFTYALRWDADMIATDIFRTAIEYWKISKAHPLFVIHGVNVFNDRKHSVRVNKNSKLKIPHINGIPFSVECYIQEFTSPEKRAFPHSVYIYIPCYWWCEDLFSPIAYNFKEYTVSLPCYAHMKFCKTSTFTNFGEDLFDIRKSLEINKPLGSDILNTLNKYKLVNIDE